MNGLFSEKIIIVDSEGNAVIEGNLTVGVSNEDGVVDIKDSTGTSKVILNSVGEDINKGRYDTGDVEDVEDDETITLPSGRDGFLKVIAKNGGAIQYSFCFIKKDGSVIDLSINSSLIAFSDSDSNLCIFQSGSNTIIKNRLGSIRSVFYKYENF